MVFARSLVLVSVLVMGVLGGVAAQTIPVQEMVDGAVVTGDRVDFGSASPVAIPKGSWKVLKRSPFVSSGDLNMARYTLVNRDLAAALKIVSFATMTERYRRLGTSDLFKCKDIPGYAVQGHNLSPSGWNYACSNYKQYVGWQAFLSSISGSTGDVDSYGMLNGFILPLLADKEALASTGDSPLIVQAHVGRAFDRNIYYTFGLKVPSGKVVPLQGQVALEQWVRGTVKAALNATNGETFAMLPFTDSLVLTAAEASPVGEPIVVPDATTLPLNEEAKKQSLIAKLAPIPVDNRACMISDNGRNWGCGWKSWPFNEVLAGNACSKLSRPQSSVCRFYLVNDRQVWAESSISRN